MKIIEIDDRTRKLINKLLEVWEDSVKKTHLFLTDEEIQKIKEYVPQALNEVSHLVMVMDEYNNPIAFMGINDTKLEMLFIKSTKRGIGIGKSLLSYGIKNYNVNELIVMNKIQVLEVFMNIWGLKFIKDKKLMNKVVLIQFYI